MAMSVSIGDGSRDRAVRTACVIALAAGCALVPRVASALEVAGVKLPERIRLTAQGPDLLLNGAGLRTRAYVRLYVAGLYLTVKHRDARLVLADKGPKRIVMNMLRDVTAQQFNDALAEGLRENHTPSELESLRVPLDEFAASMTRIGIARAGVAVALDYLPGVGTRVMVNGVARGKPVAGDDLYPALLRIWLGDDPVDRGLRRALLGQ